MSSRLAVMLAAAVAWAIPADAQIPGGAFTISPGGPDVDGFFSGSAITTGSDGLGVIAYADGAGVRGAHCEDPACVFLTVSPGLPPGGSSPSIAIGSDGLPLVAYGSFNVVGQVWLAKCHDVRCATVTARRVDDGYRPRIVLGSDNLPLLAYVGPSGPPHVVRTAHCADLLCTAATTASHDPIGS